MMLGFVMMPARRSEPQLDRLDRRNAVAFILLATFVSFACIESMLFAAHHAAFGPIVEQAAIGLIAP